MSGHPWVFSSYYLLVRSLVFLAKYSYLFHFQFSQIVCVHDDKWDFNIIHVLSTLSRLPNVPVLNRGLRQKIDRRSFRLSIEVARKGKQLLHSLLFD